MGNLSSWITFFCSVIVATIISLATFFSDIRKHKQDLIAQAITANRIEWITNVRKLVGDFLSAYVSKRSQEDLTVIRIQIELYLCKNRYYNRLSLLLKDCCDGTYSLEKVEKVIEEAQIVLQRAWRRIKIEGGQNKKDDQYITEAVDEYEIR